jgi:hypothetical protein
MWRVSVSWDNDEKTIIRWKFQADWTWPDVYHAIELETELLDSVDYTVHTIADMRWMTQTPTSAFSMVKDAIKSRHANLGLTIFLGSNIYARMMYQMVVTVYPEILQSKQLHMTVTEADAYDLIKQYNQDSSEA